MGKITVTNLTSTQRVGVPYPVNRILRPGQVLTVNNIKIEDVATSKGINGLVNAGVLGVSVSADDEDINDSLELAAALDGLLTGSSVSWSENFPVRADSIINESMIAPYGGTIDSIKVVATGTSEPASVAGTYVVSVTNVTQAKEYLSAATLSLEGLTLDTPVDLGLAADLDMNEEDYIKITVTSDNADLTPALVDGVPQGAVRVTITYRKATT